MDYIIVIPTYKRPQRIHQKGTLKFLKEMKIPKEKIFLFLANKTEEKEYKKEVPSDIYNKCVVGKKGILNQRDFIVKYYPERKYIISIDDDIEDLLIRVDSKKLRSINRKELINLFVNSHNLLKESGAFMWGINMVSNPFMMSDKINTNLGIIPAGFYGFINRHKMKNKIRNDAREDVERSIMYFKEDGLIVRYMNITFKTIMRDISGGIQAVLGKNNRVRKEMEYVDKLEKKYSDYCCIRKKGGVGISLRRKKSEKKMEGLNILMKLTKKKIKNSLK